MSHDPVALRLEMLRLRGQADRAEVVAAVADVRLGVAPIVRAVRVVQGASTRSGLMSALSARPAWVWTAALLAARALRRHPRLVLAAAGGGLVLSWLARGRRASDDSDAPQPHGHPDDPPPDPR